MPQVSSRRPRCSCKGRSGSRKTSYRSRQHAFLAALQRGWQPCPYPCPSGSGWHLTHPDRAWRRV